MQLSIQHNETIEGAVTKHVWGYVSMHGEAAKGRGYDGGQRICQHITVGVYGVYNVDRGTEEGTLLYQLVQVWELESFPGTRLDSSAQLQCLPS